MFSNQSIDIVLISDQNEDPRRVATLLSPILAGGSRLKPARRADEAIAFVQAGPVDVILLPSASESELALLDRLRTEIASLGVHVPIILFGGADDAEAIAQAITRGAADYLPHGQFDGPLLIRAIRYACARRADLQKMQAVLAAERAHCEVLRADLQRSNDALETAQMQLLQVEKMETVGRLAAGIAHEVKNPLAIIRSGIDYLHQKAAEDEKDAMGLSRVLGSMGRAVKKADSVIRGLLDFSAPAALHARPCDLNLVVRQALVLVNHELTRGKIVLETEMAEPLPLVSVDANKIEQVFLNLVMNAIHAMPDGGKLIIRTRAEQLATLGHHIGDDRAERFRAGDIVVLTEVDDTGHGIPPDKLSKVFDPFFTTKPTGKGTGLGLSVARTIIELHGGMLQLSNRPEGGARALLVLKATGDIQS